MIFELDKNTKKLNIPMEKTSLNDLSLKEKDLEDIIANGLAQQILANDIMPIFRERSRQEECDIYALDKDGNLIFYELKRYQSEKENLLQVMRYAQMYGGYDYNDLNDLYIKYLKEQGTSSNGIKFENLRESHQFFFSLQEPLEISEFNRKNKLYIVTDGVDYETVEKIEYWRNNGVDINAIKYGIYEIGNKVYIDFSDFSFTSNMVEKGCHIVNTNTSYFGNIKEKEMLEKHWASACGGQKWTIDKIKKQDIVFLYSTGKGIIAYGVSSSQVKGQDDVDEGKDYNHYVELDKFQILVNPISANTINKLCGTSWKFRNTRFGISKESADIIIKYINDNEPKSLF